MPAPFFPDEVCFADATAKQAALALSKIRLFKEGYVPTNATTRVALVANECDYDDYLAQEITAWLAPTKSVYGGAEITAPTEQFLCAAAQVTANSVAGYWIETAGGALVLVRQFDSPQPMAQANDAIKITPNYVFPNG